MSEFNFYMKTHQPRQQFTLCVLQYARERMGMIGNFTYSVANHLHCFNDISCSFSGSLLQRFVSITMEHL